MTTAHNMKVIVVQKNKGVAVEHKPIPQPKAKEVLLRILAVGQNPTDYKHVDYELAKPGDYLGCDYVGEVVDMGPEVPKDQVKKGEIRWNFCRGGRGPKGAFAEYITSEWDLTSLVPPNITPEQAAGLPIPLLTAVQALYLPARLNLPEPPVSKPSNEWILIWSGATSVGIYAIQLAKLSGLKVATTASPKRWDQLKGYGADVCVDYKDPDVVDKLKKATNDGIKHGVDCVTNGESYRKSQLAFGPQGGHLITTLFEIEDLPRSDVKVTPTLVYTGLGEDHYWGDFHFPTDKTHRDLHAHWAKKLTKLLGEGKLKPAEINVLGGLEDIPKGLDLMREGKHDGKLVYSVAKAAASGSV